MRLRRRPTPEPDPHAGEDDLHPIFELGSEYEDEAVGTHEPEADAGYVPDAAPDLGEAQAEFEHAAVAAPDEHVLGEHAPVHADPTATIPDHRVNGDEEPLHDPAPSGPLTLTPQAAALAAEACSKSSAIWVKPAGTAQFRLAWHVWHADAVHVVSGVGEQLLPPLLGEVEIAVRSKDDGSRLITFVAQGQEVPPSSADWGPAVDTLAAARLNAPDPAELRTRWAGGTTVYRLVPVAYQALGAGSDATDPGNVKPPRIAATTVGPQPWHLGGRKRRIRGIWKRDGKGELIG